MTNNLDVMTGGLVSAKPLWQPAQKNFIATWRHLYQLIYKKARRINVARGSFASLEITLNLR